MRREHADTCRTASHTSLSDSASSLLACLLDPARLGALDGLGLMDGAPEPAYDRVTALVRRVLGVPTALVSLVGSDRQVFKSADGLGEPWLTRRQTPLSHSFCQHVVAHDAPLDIADARLDARVRDNGAVDRPGRDRLPGLPDPQPGRAPAGLALRHQPGAARLDRRRPCDDGRPGRRRRARDRAAGRGRGAHPGRLGRPRERGAVSPAHRDRDRPHPDAGHVGRDRLRQPGLRARPRLRARRARRATDHAPHARADARLAPRRLRALPRDRRARALSWDRVEVPMERADGTEIPVAIAFSEFVRDGQTFFTGIVRDMTAEKEAEARIRAPRGRVPAHRRGAPATRLDRPRRRHRSSMPTRGCSTTPASRRRSTPGAGRFTRTTGPRARARHPARRWRRRRRSRPSAGCGAPRTAQYRWHIVRAEPVGTERAPAGSGRAPTSTTCARRATSSAPAASACAWSNSPPTTWCGTWTSRPATSSGAPRAATRLGWDDLADGTDLEWWCSRIHADDRDRVEASFHDFVSGDDADMWKETLPLPPRRRHLRLYRRLRLPRARRGRRAGAGRRGDDGPERAQGARRRTRRRARRGRDWRRASRARSWPT